MPRPGRRPRDAARGGSGGCMREAAYSGPPGVALIRAAFFQASVAGAARPARRPAPRIRPASRWIGSGIPFRAAPYPELPRRSGQNAGGRLLIRRTRRGSHACPGIRRSLFDSLLAPPVPPLARYMPFPTPPTPASAGASLQFLSRLSDSSILPEPGPSFRWQTPPACRAPQCRGLPALRRRDPETAPGALNDARMERRAQKRGRSGQGWHGFCGRLTGSREGTPLPAPPPRPARIRGGAGRSPRRVPGPLARMPDAPACRAAF